MKNIWHSSPVISPSLISLCDLCSIERSVKELEAGGAKLLHIDILDGYFSPSMPLGLDTVRRLRQLTELPFDVHLMVREPDFFIGELLDIGVQQLTFHAETESHIDNRLNQIHRFGVRSGVALKPSTPLCVLDYVLEKCDNVLLMLINPGYASFPGERQVCYGRRKVEELSGVIRSRGLDTTITLDGRVSRENIRELSAYADIFVAGSTCADRSRPKESISELISFSEQFRR